MPYLLKGATAGSTSRGASPPHQATRPAFPLLRRLCGVRFPARRATGAGNLAGFCTRHHRGKHQAPGRHHRLSPDDRLTVTTPTGLTTPTGPPPY